MTSPSPLDAAARDELRAKAEAARDTMAYAACRVLDGVMDHEANAIASKAQGEFLHAVSSPAVILALLAAVERGEADTALRKAAGAAFDEINVNGASEDSARAACNILGPALTAFDLAARAHPPTE